MQIKYESRVYAVATFYFFVGLASTFMRDAWSLRKNFRLNERGVPLQGLWSVEGESNDWAVVVSRYVIRT
jgi:hypothetical protein